MRDLSKNPINNVYKVIDTDTHIKLSNLISVSSIFTNKTWHGSELGYKIDNYHFLIKCKDIEPIIINDGNNEDLTKTHNDLVDTWNQYESYS